MNYVLKEVIEKNPNIKLKNYEIREYFKKDLAIEQTPEILIEIKSQLKDLTKEDIFEIMTQLINYNSRIYQSYLSAFVEDSNVDYVMAEIGCRKSLAENIINAISK